MKPYLVALGLSLVISWILTPAVKKLAFHLGAVDRPNARKVHHRIMPRMGGLAIFIGFMTAALTTLELTTDVIGILLGGAAIAAVGMVDDMIQLSAKVKLVGQIVAALIPVLFGVRIEWLNNPWGGYFYLDYLSVPFTVFWIVSLTNVVNLIDGLDGLADIETLAVDFDASLGQNRISDHGSGDGTEQHALFADLGVDGNGLAIDGLLERVGVGNADGLALLNVVATLLELLEVALGSGNSKLLGEQIILSKALSDLYDVALAALAANLVKKNNFHLCSPF